MRGVQICTPYRVYRYVSIGDASLFCITLIGKGELLITIMSSLAQEESRSISENVTWGHRKRFADGKVSVLYRHFLGYDKGPDGNLAVSREQARTVKLIYRLFLDRYIFHSIARELTARGLETPFSSKIKCGQCGGWYGAKVWHSTDKYRRTIYRCNNKYDGHKCQTPHVTKENIKSAFVTAFNRLVTEREEIAANARLVRQTFYDTTELEREKASMGQELAVLVEMTQNCIAENARVAQDQGEYPKRYNGLVERYEKAKARFDEVTEAIAERSAKGERLRRDGGLCDGGRGRRHDGAVPRWDGYTGLNTCTVQTDVFPYGE